MAQTLKFGNGNFATKAGSTLCYDDQNGNFKPIPMDFTRASTATRVNKQGLIEVVKSNVPRIDYTDTSDGVLLLEKAATNLETKSNEFSTWQINSNITRTANYIVSPDGTLNGTRLQFTANGFSSNTPQSLATYTMSCYAKRNDSGTQNVGFFTNGSGVVNSAWEITTEWKRFSYTFPALNGSYMGIAGVSGADISVYGFQIEGLSSYASSYIPTQGSAVTRVAETASGSGNSEVFNDSEGVLFADISALVGSGGGTRRIEVSNGVSATQYVRLQIANGDGSLYAILNNGSQQFLFNETSFNATLPNKISLKYKQNDFSLFLNGFEVGSSNVGNTFANGVLTQVNFSSTASEFYGKTKEIGYYDEILTDLELETLTSYRSWESMVNELNLNIIYNG